MSVADPARRAGKASANVRPAPPDPRREQLRALAQVARGVCHDINNALTPIIGAADFMVTHQQILDNRADTVHLLECIRSAAGEAKALVSRLRAFYRPTEELEVRSVHVNPLLESLIQLVEPRRLSEEEKLSIRIRMETQLGAIPPVRASEAQLREVLLNIMLNAIVAMPHGGVLSLRTEWDKEWVHIHVQDSGIGMSPDVLKQCFDPFFSTKSGNGAGIGLSLAYFVIDNCGGAIDIYSEPGIGTTVHIKLPADPAAHAVPKQPLPAAPTGKHVLLVLKNAETRKIMSAYLKAGGHDVEAVADAEAGARAMDICRFDVMIVGENDVGPRRAGQLRLLRERAPGAVLLLLKNYDPPPSEARAMPEDVDAVLGKSITCMELLEAVHAAAERGANPPQA